MLKQSFFISNYFFPIYCQFICCFRPSLEFFHSNGNVTIAAEWLQNCNYWSEAAVWLKPAPFLGYRRQTEGEGAGAVFIRLSEAVRFFSVPRLLGHGKSVFRVRRMRDIYTCCRAFGSGTVNTLNCFNFLSVLQLDLQKSDLNASPTPFAIVRTELQDTCKT